jgi:hypothetical protein
MGVIAKRWGLRVMAVLLMGCAFIACSAADPVISEWRNPAYNSPNFKRMLVSGPGFATSIRRNFEDAFVAQLRAAGTDALPSYSILPDEQPDEASIKQAAQKLGADAALVVRPIKVEGKIEYGPAYLPVPWFGYFGPAFGASWYGGYGLPSVYRYNEYTSETTVYDIAKKEVVWSGTLRSIEPDNVQTAIKSYVSAIIRALNENSLLTKSSTGSGGM